MRRARISRVGTVLVLLAAFLSTAPVLAGEVRGEPESVRVIVQLAQPSLAVWAASQAGTTDAAAVRTADGHLDVEATASQTYVASLVANQEAFIAGLVDALPAVRPQQRYQIGFDGFAAIVPRASLEAIRKLPGVVAVTETYELEPELDQSKTLINLPALWAALPGGNPAGTGRRYASIDSGLNAAHPFFADAGFTAPPGYPKSQRYEAGSRTALPLATYTNNKVIVANVYIQPGDTTAANILPFGGGSMHGTHTAGIGAGVEGSYTVNVSGAPFTMTFSGMAPGAWVMSYRVTGDTAEYLAAIDDLIADQADAVNLSLGHSRWLTTDTQHDPLREALDAAVDAGVVVVGSAGNAGANGEGSITGAWKYSPKVITVANSTHQRVFSNTLSSSTGPTNTQNRVAVPAASPAPAVTSPITAQVALAPGGTGGDAGDGCTPAITAGSMTGKICLVMRGGTCTGGFAQKQAACVTGGAVAMVVYNQALNAGAVPPTMGSLLATIPSVAMTRADGLNLISWLGITPADPVTISTVVRTTGGWPDIVDGSSSQGPTGINTIKPDVAAPGSNILSSVVDDTTGLVPAEPFALLSGTSMATPHITGLAVLTKALHPTWTPAQIKSAIMNTAEPAMWLDVANTPPGALAKHRGAGRVKADGLISPSLTFSPPSVSFGLVASGTSSSVLVRVKDMRTSGGIKNWTLSVNPVLSDAAVTVSTSVAAGTTTPGQSTQFSVNLTALGVPPVAQGGTVEGFVVATDGSETFRIPYWVRVQDPAAVKDVLVIDWDRSTSLTDFQAVYTNALTTLGKTFDVFAGGSSTAANGNPGVSMATLQNYRNVVLFMGNNTTSWSTAHTFGSFPLQDYLVGGGRLLVVGQGLNSGASYNQNVGTDFNFTVMAGWVRTDQNFYGAPAAGTVSTTKVNLFGDIADFSANSSGSGTANQLLPDAGRPVQLSDVDDLFLYNGANISRHARALGTYTQTDLAGVPATRAGTVAATGVAGDPTLEIPQPLVNWRAALLHLGLEGVNANLGTHTPVTVLGSLLGFLNDEVTASLTVTGAGLLRNFTCNAAALHPTATIASYRWDFGDGSPFATTVGNTTTHTYASTGAYTARCQPIDNLTRTTVASRNVVATCPAIAVAPATLPSAILGVPYSQSVTASGGIATYTYQVTGGALPANLTLALNGTVGGTPSALGLSTATIEATDANACKGSSSVAIEVLPVDLFADEFETGDVSGWDGVTP